MSCLLSHAFPIVRDNSAAGVLIAGKGCGWFLDNKRIMHQILFDCSLNVTNVTPLVVPICIFVNTVSALVQYVTVHLNRNAVSTAHVRITAKILCI
jgi:hypothetical protein